MQCPFCGSDSQVADSRSSTDGVRRRRSCTSCKRRFTTYERIGAPNLKVLKRTGPNEPFDSNKLRAVLRRVCRHRPSVREVDVDRIVRSVETELLAATTKVIRSGQIVDLVLARLAELDRVSHDRLAANYVGEDGQLRTDTRAPSGEVRQKGLFERD